MSEALEPNYVVGLKEVPSMEKRSEKLCEKGLNLKATELRLGLPGSESPERDGGGGGGGAVKSAVVCGAKRGFSDTMKGGCGKWVMSGNGGSEVGLVKDTIIPHSPKPLLHDKKPQISAIPQKYYHLSFFLSFFILLSLLDLLLQSCKRLWVCLFVFLLCSLLL